MPRNQPPRRPVSLRISDEAHAAAAKIVDENPGRDLTVPDVLRQAISAGLPLVEQRVKEPTP